MTPSARKEAIRRAEDAALKAASESRWDDAYSFLEIRRGLLKMDQDHLSAADSSAASGSVIPARPTLPAEDGFALISDYEQGRQDERHELASVLPGTTYMDPPDGGAPSILEQLERQAKDAARYLWLREQTSIRNPDFYAKVARWSVSKEFGGYGHCYSGRMLDDAIDAAMSPQATQEPQ